MRERYCRCDSVVFDHELLSQVKEDFSLGMTMMLKKNENAVLRTIHGSIFLIDISDNYSGDKCSLYEINETGRFLWDAVDQNRSIDELVVALQNAIIDEVPRDVLLNDVTEYINDLIGKRFISEVAANG